MCGPLSVTLSDIWMVKMENNTFIPHKPIFYKRYVDDVINRRKKHEEDILFKKLNNYHTKIKLKLVSAIFYQFFIFHRMIALQKL